MNAETIISQYEKEKLHFFSLIVTLVYHNEDVGNDKSVFDTPSLHSLKPLNA